MCECACPYSLSLLEVKAMSKARESLLLPRLEAKLIGDKIRWMMEGECLGKWRAYYSLCLLSS